MKKKLLISFAVLVVLFVGAAIVLPMFFKDAIAARVKAEINKRVNAEVNFSDLSLTLLTSFPRLTLSIDDLSVTGINEFAGYRLATVKSTDVKLSLWDVIGGGKTTISSITLDQPDVNVIVLKNGKANYDIARPEPEAAASSEPSSFSMAVQSYAIRNGKVSYDDRKGGTKLVLDNLNHSGSGDFTSDLFTLRTKTTIDRTNVWSGGVKYLSDVRTSLDSDLQADLANMKFTAKDSVLSLNELKLALDGFVAMPGKDIDVDLTFAAKQNEFKNFMSLIPGVYREGFKDVVASGALAMNGFVKGRYTATRIPGFGLNVSVKNGSFKYPSLPAAVTNANLDLGLTNPDGVPDHTLVDLRQLHAELGGEPIDARLKLATPVSDPQIDGMLKGTINLGNVKSYIPLEKGTELSGVVVADVTMKGRYAAVANKQVEQLQAAGRMSMTDVRYSGDGIPPTVIKSMSLTFNPKNATLENMNASVGKSQIVASGSLDNLPAYYFKNEELRGNLTVESPVLDLNEFAAGTPAGESSSSAGSGLPGGVITLPANMDLSAQANIGKVLYDTITIENVKGVVTLKDQVLDMKGLTFTMLNGNVAMSGQYATPNPQRPQIAYNLTVGNLDIQQTAKTFDSVRTLTPIAEHAKGLFNAELNIVGVMDEKNRPILNTINGKGKVTTNSVSLANFAPLNKIADALKMGDLKDIPLPRTIIQFTIKEGRVITDPFETNLAGIPAKIQGSSGLDHSLQYAIGLAIPRDRLKGPALNAINGLLSKVGTIAGSAAQLPDPVKVNLLLEGSAENPTVKLALAGGPGTSIGDTLKDKAQEAIKDKVQEQLKTSTPDKVSDLADPAKAAEKAKEEAAKLVAEAEAQAQQIRDAAKASADKVKKEGYEAADKLVAAAGSNPLKKLAAQKAADNLRKETDQKAQKIIDDGNANATKLVEEARKKGGGGT